MKHLSRSPFLWGGATLLSALLYFFAFHFFPKTFPIIHLDITMDLKQALQSADDIAQKYNIGPTEHRNAAMFFTDTAVKTFVELEAGGKDAFIAMMEEQLYMPYTWRVRHFKECEKNEATLFFTPDGKPYGFIEAISENNTGAQLNEHDALAKIEQELAPWNINLEEYKLVESSQKKQPSLRIDHTFVYERINKKIGEGVYRLKIVISGDKLTEVVPFVKIPEAFNHRYIEMYSANNTIAWSANLIMILLYFIGGCCFGLYWIIRRRWELFRQPALWALCLATASFFVSLNQLPFLWMNYNSAYSCQGFFIQLLLSFCIGFMAKIVFLTIIIATAESLTRKAFGHHPQLWSLWFTKNSATYPILGRTVAGYLMVGFNCAFIIAFYLLSARYLQWWTPSEMMFDPNILATYIPWLSPIAQSINAGFMEECLFRAIPLAGAALLGSYYGKKNWWIGAAFIVQAIVFGAAHANYPTQPSYIRLIELIIPSLIWGITYLQWGLLPTIIAHTLYDIIWFSLPIFVSHTPQSFFSQIMIVIISSTPLLYLIYARLKEKKWSSLSLSALNESWQAPSPTEKEKQEETIITEFTNLPLNRRKYIIVVILGLLGLIAWIWNTPFSHDGITITIDRNTAIQQSQDFLNKKNITLNAPWKTLPLFFNNYAQIPQIAAQHKFIWKEGNKQLYHSLLGTYLEPAHWTIRYAQFDLKDVHQRSEEHKIMLYDETILRHHHQLPENAAGELLTQKEARIIAHNAILTTYAIDPDTLNEISAEEGLLPNRRNWLFTFSNPALYPLTTGQARITVLIAGNEVIDINRIIYVPEEWERSEQNKNNIRTIIAIIFALLFTFFLFLSAFIASRKNKESLFSQQLFFILCGIMTFISIAESMNVWQTIIGSLNTSEPSTNQLFQQLTSLFISYLVKGSMLALGLTYALLYGKKHAKTGFLTTITSGLSIGLFFAGILSIGHRILPMDMPLWPHYDSLINSYPWLSSILSSINNYLYTTLIFSLFIVIIDKATNHWNKNRLLLCLVSILCGISPLTLSSTDLIAWWISIGTIIGLIGLTMYRYILRYNYALIPFATCSFIILNIIQQGIFNAYPGAINEALFGIITTITTTLIWYWYIQKNNN